MHKHRQFLERYRTNTALRVFSWKLGSRPVGEGQRRYRTQQQSDRDSHKTETKSHKWVKSHSCRYAHAQHKVLVRGHRAEESSPSGFFFYFLWVKWLLKWDKQSRRRRRNAWSWPQVFHFTTEGSTVGLLSSGNSSEWIAQRAKGSVRSSTARHFTSVEATGPIKLWRRTITWHTRWNVSHIRRLLRPRNSWTAERVETPSAETLIVIGCLHFLLRSNETNQVISPLLVAARFFLFTMSAWNLSP